MTRYAYQTSLSRVEDIVLVLLRGVDVRVVL
jgi:hypothetical protein